MEPGDRAIPLKQSAKRSVERTVERTGGPGAEVVKRFHSPGPFDRWLDRVRARSEYEMLRELVARDMPVPRPIEVRRTERGWELSTEWIDGAVSLADVLAGRARWPAPKESVARTLGALLARAHAAGLDHPDLHGGNVLVGPGDRAWLVDVHGARIHPRPSSRIAVRDLVQLAADTRERMPVGLRARVLSAWRSALPSSIASELPPQKELADTVERAARERRRAAVERARTRWTRNSSACRARSSPEFTGFVSAEIADRDPNELRTRSAAIIVLDDMPARDLLAHWYCAARLLDHGLRAARPLVYSRSPHPWAAFGLPAGARALESTKVRAFEGSIGDLAGSLFDRGLAVPSFDPSSLYVDEHGEVCLGPVASLRNLAPNEPPRFSGKGSAAFVSAQLSGPRERERVRAALEADRDG